MRSVQTAVSGSIVRADWTETIAATSAGGVSRGGRRTLSSSRLQKGGPMLPAQWIRLAVFGAIVLSADLAEAKQRWVLATGRRDPRFYAIDLEQALRPGNNNTSNAIVSRSLVSPKRLDGELLGDPANIVLSEDQKTAFVMNHHGAVVNAEFLQHGGRASIAVMDVRKMLSRELDNTDAALEHDFDAGWFGGVGLLVVPGLIVAGYSESWLSEDGSIMDFGAALAGSRVVEVAPRIPVQTGPFGIRASPNGKFVAVTARESNITGAEGNTISIIEIDRARAGLPGAEAARVRVGTDAVNGAARPFTVSWTPDGRRIVVANFRTNNVSVVDLRKALDHVAGAEVARISLTRVDGNPARPKGTAVTSDGRFAVVTGGANTLPDRTPTGTVFLIDLSTNAQVATVTGVGIDPYNLALVEDVDG